MKKYLVFCIFIPIILIIFFNTFFFNVDFFALLKIIAWMYMFQWSAYLLHPWLSCLLQGRSLIFLGTLRVFFLVAFTYIIWLIPQFKILFFSPSFVWSVFLFFIFLSIGGYYLASKKDILIFNESAFKEILIQDSLFQYTFIAFLVLHSLYPDSSWGEKSMDLSLLSYLIRRDYFPIFDNWSPDVVMKYYYWGYYCYAGFLKMLNLSNTVGYTVVAATLPALMVTSLYSLFRWVTKQRVLAIGGAIFVICSSNWAAFYLKLVNFPKDHFWYTTRVFENGSFAEYPFWSFIFKDLHPHVFAYPITIVLLTFVYLVRDPYIKSMKYAQYVFYFFLALVWGSLIGFNGWDFLIYSIMIMWFVSLDKNIFKEYKTLLYLIILFVVTVILYLPMLQILRTGTSVDFGFVVDKLNHIGNYYMYLGTWFNIIFLIFLFYFFHMKRTKFRINKWISLPLALATFALFQVVAKKMIFNDIIIFCLIAMITINILWASKDDFHYYLNFSFKLLLVALTFIFLAEHLYFMDRLNTIFKTLNNVWIWFAICAVILLRLPARILNSQFKIKNLKYLIWSFSLMIFIVIGTIGSVLLSYSFYKLNDKFSLDPLSAYVKWDKGAYEAIQWINKNIKGTPIILEAVGEKPFDLETLRISKFTGLPTYIGWPNHVMLRGTAYQVALNKVKSLETIYNTKDASLAFKLLRAGAVNYIFIGATEIHRYQTLGLQKFFDNKTYFELVRDFSGSYLFKLRE
ncbi:MAG: hypothetical protein A2202_07245 [Bdellovibrionales bacterium RIFOXYA1_FULL_36_14]|nr:MAG: hypothetical protein A2202_07245 [Bdellovibrionales bacterium RIFOXYA1_FULL_36_14]